MKTIVIIILFMALIAIGADTASAAVSVNASATMSSDVLYQGRTISANVTVINNENFPIRVYSVGAHYDWMPENAFSQADLGKDYVQVESNGITSPAQLLIQCRGDAATGYHSFFYRINLTWYNSYTNTWLNETAVQPGTIYVESPLKPEALQELQFANITLSGAKNTTFMSKNAIAAIQNATDLINDGWSAYYANDFSRAINDSYDAISFVSNARVAERNYLDSASKVEGVVSSVRDKLRSVSATSDPDTKSALREADGYLNTSAQYFDAEDFLSALTYARKADQAADKAINLQFYYFLKTNETEAARGRARLALDNAQASLDNASGMMSTSAQGILRDARLKMEDAAIKFSEGDYVNASVDANAVSDLVGKANWDEAGYHMALAHSKIDALGGAKSPEAMALLANASSIYSQSEDDLNASDYAGAIAHADLASGLADDAATAEQKWRDENPAAPGFEGLAVMLALAAVFIILDRKG